MAEKPITKAELESLLAHEQEVSDSLRQVLKASEALVTSLEGRLKVAAAEKEEMHRWFSDERNITKGLREENSRLIDRIRFHENTAGPLVAQCEQLRDRLNRALGWIDHAQGKGPEVNEPEPGYTASEMQFRGGRLG